MPEAHRDYEDVYARTYGRLVGQLSVITGSAQEAQDAVQEALFRAWLRWTKVGAYDDPEAWIRRVAINVATSRWRKLRRLVPPPTGQEETGQPVAELTEDVLDLLATIGRIPRRQREALVLFYLADMSAQEVADTLAIRVGSVKGLLSRGRQSLHRLLSEDDARGEAIVR
jgi:RNA polymerase sigma-70 factor, ECF subfamily